MAQTEPLKAARLLRRNRLHNRLRGLGDGRALAGLRGLRKLSLSHNELGAESPGLPHRLAELASLEELDLSFNRLRHLPEGLGCLRHLPLESLMLDGNQLQTLPAGFSGLQRLKMLNLSSNLLEELVLQGNQIAILPEGFGQLSRVTLWKIKDNPLIQPPYEVCMKGIPYIAAYQQELAHSQPALKPRLKLVLMGLKDADASQVLSGLRLSGSKGIEVMDWTADAERGLTFIVYELAGDPGYDVIQSFFLSPGALYVLVVPHAVVCMVGTHADLCAERELEEKCLDIHHQIAQQEKRDAEGLQSLVQQVDEALGQDFDLRCSSPHTAFYGVSDKNLRRKKAQFQYLLNHRPQILSPVLPFSCWDHCQVLEELHFQPQAQQLWLSWWDSARLGLQAGLTEDRLQSALSYLHESGKLLYFEEHLTLREYVFHNLPRLIDILNVFCQRDATVLLQKLLSDTHVDELKATQLHHYVEGFLLHGLLPAHVIRLLLKPHVQSREDLQLILELLEKMGLCYCVNKPKSKPLNGAAAWYKFPCYVKNEVPHAEAWINGANLSGQSFVVEQLQIEYSFPFIFPPGLFARYSVQINSHVVQRSDGKYQIYAYRGKVPVVVKYRPAWGALQPDTLSIASHASLPNIWTAWQAITPLVEELNVLLQEWPGLYYTVHVLCSKCLKRGSPNPHSFPVKWRVANRIPPLAGVFSSGGDQRSQRGGDTEEPAELVAGELLSQPRPEGLTEIICPKNGSERVNVALVYPPTPTVISPCSK
ncbi:UNVERIFIED_CONTAM: hypothetical protein H355_012186 [Colinus virginianus]|nr:hypothetical protein H355_012186 [Colinus virginianus]